MLKSHKILLHSLDLLFVKFLLLKCLLNQILLLLVVVLVVVVVVLLLLLLLLLHHCLLAKLQHLQSLLFLMKLYICNILLPIASSTLVFYVHRVGVRYNLCADTVILCDTIIVCCGQVNVVSLAPIQPIYFACCLRKWGQ